MGEVLQRIIGLVVMKIVRCDLQQAEGFSQQCASQMGGCGTGVTGIHAKK